MGQETDDRPPDALVARLRAAGCVFAEDEAQLLVAAARSSAELEAMVERRVAGLPLELVVGWAELCGVRVAVDPGVFVPRARSAALVRAAVELARLRPTSHTPTVVVDLCCGTGALGLAIAAQLGAVELHAADVDPAAVRCARRNVGPVGGHVHEGDLDAALPTHLVGRVDVLVANAPYVPTAAIATLPREARLHEPTVALDGGIDGLDVVRRVLTAAPRWLAPGGCVLVETTEEQADALVGDDPAVALHALGPDEHDTVVVIGRARSPV